MRENGAGRLLFPGIVFFVSFAVYIYTLCPTVYWDDAGELIAACYTLGIPHPPGHPLYAILGWLFTLLPVGSPAYRVNLMSAFFGALSCSVLLVIVKDMVKRDEAVSRFANLAGITAALSAAFSLILWDQSVVAETTTLHSFFMLIVTMIVFRIDAAGPTDIRLSKGLLLLSFVYGLSFTNHVAGLFFAPSVGFVLLYRIRRDLFNPGRLAAMALLFALGLCVYVYLPLRSRYDPAIDWGNPETLRNFLWVVTARQYSSNLVRIPSAQAVVLGFVNLAKVFVSNLTPLGVGLAVYGAARLWKTRKAVVIYGLLVIAILFPVSLNNAFIFVYLLPATLLATVWSGYGVACVCERGMRTASESVGVRKPLFEWSPKLLAISLVLLLFGTHLDENNKRRYWHAYEYGISLLSKLPENALLITGSADPLFISWYLQYCENYRTDIKVITRNGLVRPGYLEQVRLRHPELNVPREFQYEEDQGVRPGRIHERGDGLPWYANSYFKSLYDLNVAAYPVFWEGIESNQLLIERFVPYELVFQIAPPGGERPYARFVNLAEVRARIGDDRATRKVYGNHIFNYGLLCQLRADSVNAERWYSEAVALNPDDSRALNNLGTILSELGRDDEAFERFSAALRVNPNDATSNHNVGQALLNRGEFRKAIRYFRRTMALDPGGFEDYYSLALCYGETGEYKRAIRMFKYALELKPDSPEALSSLGVIYLRVGETENAEKLLKAATDLEPHNAENWYNFACLHVTKGDTALAGDSLSRALTLDRQATYALAAKDSRMASLLSSLSEVPATK